VLSLRTVFLHGLGQTAKDWDETIKRTSDLEADCPEVFSLPVSLSRWLFSL